MPTWINLMLIMWTFMKYSIDIDVCDDRRDEENGVILGPMSGVSVGPSSGRRGQMVARAVRNGRHARGLWLCNPRSEPWACIRSESESWTRARAGVAPSLPLQPSIQPRLYASVISMMQDRNNLHV